MVQLTPERLVSVFLPQQLPSSWRSRPEVPWSGQEPVSRAWVADLWRWLEVRAAAASRCCLVPCTAAWHAVKQHAISHLLCM